MTSRPLEGRIALVTGASRGIGQASAVALGAAGAKVFALARTQGGLEEVDDAILAAGGERASLVTLDLTDGAGVDRLGYEIFHRHKRLDVLVHAAAVLGRLRPVAHAPPEVWERSISLNVTAAFRLIRSLEPLLRASVAGRAIFLTSGAARRPRAFWGAYAASKAALDTLVRCWAEEVDASPLRVILVDPGPMRTRMRAEAYPGEDPSSLADPNQIGPLIVELSAAARDPGLPHEVVRFGDWKNRRTAPSRSQA